jgi:hypothetical protein
VRHRAILPYELHEGPQNAISCPLRSTEGERWAFPRTQCLSSSRARQTTGPRTSRPA